MSTILSINASRANGAPSRDPRTEAGKAPICPPAMPTKLRDEDLQPNTNSIERDLVEEMVVSKCLTRRAWRLESSSINYEMDEQKGDVEANSAALPQIQSNQVRNLRGLQDQRRNAKSVNA
jgi:hypothetical protein